MDERMVKGFFREEEFLEEYGEIARITANLLHQEWIPSYSANDETRANITYFIKSRELSKLVFENAFIYHIGNKFSSVVINLISSYRKVTVKVKLVDNQLVADKLIDKSIQ